MEDLDSHQKAVERATVAKMRQLASQYQQNSARIEDCRRVTEQLEAEQAELRAQADQCYATAALFRFDLDQALQTGSDDAQLSTESWKEPAPQGKSVKELVLEHLKDAWPAPVRAGRIRRHLNSLGFDLHDKTVGMTLYRLSKTGVVRRDGFDWFFVPEAQRETAPSEPEEAV